MKTYKTCTGIEKFQFESGDKILYYNFETETWEMAKIFLIDRDKVFAGLKPWDIEKVDFNQDKPAWREPYYHLYDPELYRPYPEKGCN